MFTTLPPAQDLTRRSSLGRMVNQSTFLLMGCIGALILLLAFLILFHENANATKGYRLRTLERERSVLLLEQEVFNMQVAEAQALESLREDPLIQAMIDMRGPRYTQDDRSVALEAVSDGL